MPKFPARVHPILARKANIAVNIRRGPSKSVCTMLWDRTRDEFKLGQWLRGRIYERRCDLSTDGKHFIYFAMNGKWDGPVKGTWTAISRTPYLKALALWPWGDCWNGGGLFMTDSRFWRNAGYHSDEPDTIGRLRKKLVEEPGYPFDEGYGGECPGVYYIRLQRDGWKLLRDESPSAELGVTVFVKPLPKGWALEKLAHASIDSSVGSGCYYDTHRLLHPESGTILDHPEWEWAELDRKRLVWVSMVVSICHERITPFPPAASQQSLGVNQAPQRHQRLDQYPGALPGHHCRATIRVEHPTGSYDPQIRLSNKPLAHAAPLKSQSSTATAAASMAVPPIGRSCAKLECVRACLPGPIPITTPGPNPSWAP